MIDPNMLMSLFGSMGNGSNPQGFQPQQLLSMLTQGGGNFDLQQGGGSGLPAQGNPMSAIMQMLGNGGGNGMQSGLPQLLSMFNSGNVGSVGNAQQRPVGDVNKTVFSLMNGKDNK